MTAAAARKPEREHSIGYTDDKQENLIRLSPPERGSTKDDI
ncbi:hypothetical protein N0824_03030 [Microcystis sp. 0824]|nr:hypothetical protein N0824_03030 [Microcystis sp. 0824]